MRAPIRSARSKIGTQFRFFVAGYFCLAGAMTSAAEPSLEQKVGQVMIWSFAGTTLTPELEQTLGKYQPGALVVFRSNIASPEAIATTLAQAQDKAKFFGSAPLFVMVDQEGGAVTRVRSPTPMPSALALAQVNNAEFTKKYARTVGDLLFRLGFNVDLAPVLDVSDPKQDSFIGNRTFGSDPSRVRELTLAYARGLSDAGLVPTGKHFPGHGGTLLDSHHVVARKLSTLAQLRARDFVPFTGFAKQENPKAIMMAHLALPNVDPSGLPATYSKKIIGEHLRGTLAYDGLVITDDLEMGGASVSQDIGERAVRAFEAGNDMLMLAGSVAHQRQAFEALVNAVKSGRISKSRLDESCKRIALAKAGFKPAPKYEAKAVNASFNKLDQLSREVLHANFEAGLAQANHRWPEATSDSRVLVFGSGQRVPKDFARSYKGHVRAVQISPTSLTEARGELEKMTEDFAVFFASGKQTAKWLNQLPADLRARVVVVNANHPGQIREPASFLAVINMNFYAAESARWTAQALSEVRTKTVSVDQSVPEI